MQTINTHLPLKLFKRGKVRDLYTLDSERLLMIATDRISAFDWVLPNGVPGLGKVRTKLSAFWFKHFEKWRPTWKIRHHFLDDNVWNIGLTSKDIKENDLLGRSMIVERMDKVIPIECVARGYLAGSAWKDYQKTGTVQGQKIPFVLGRPNGLMEFDRLPQTIFTPAIKVENGHDRNITKEELREFLSNWEWTDGQPLGEEAGRELARFLEEATLTTYFLGNLYASFHGVITADTKFEFGVKGNEIVLVDEVLTPDSSRFWDKKTYEPGKQPKILDKQYLRDWLSLTDWDKNSPPPRLTQRAIREIYKRYRRVYRLLTARRSGK